MLSETRVGFRPSGLLYKQLVVCLAHTDLSTSRFLQRAVENELERRARSDEKLKAKLEKVKNGRTKSARNNK